MANIISNVADGGYKDQNVALQTLHTSEQLATFVASDLFLDGPPKTVSSKNFKLTVSLMSFLHLTNQSIGSNSGKVDAFDIPSQFNIGLGREEAIVSSLLVFHENPYLMNNGSSREQVSSNVIDIKFKDVNGTVFPVANLTQPLMIYFDKSRAKSQGACPEATFKCQYWSEDEDMWKSDGCFWIESPSKHNRIACACNHTTSFSAFVLEKGDSCVKYPGIKITGIVFNSIYSIICIPVLIGLFITRNYQPVKSRFIAPFIGISAIIVDSVIQGIVRNVLSLAAQQSASDAFSYVIMLSANPLFVTSLVVFLWQQVRYLMLHTIYRLMPRGKRALRTKFIRFNRVLASKTIFTLVSVCAGTCVLAYFAVLVGLTAHFNEIDQLQKRDFIVIVQALSFASLLIVLALGILVTLIVDVTYSVKQESSAKVKHRGTSTKQTEQLRVAKTTRFGFIWMHFMHDPLLFRAEGCFILLALLIIIVLYSIGIATIVLEPRQKHPIMIIRTIIEILFMFVRIMAFGGFVFIISLRAFLDHHQRARTRPHPQLLRESPHHTLAAATTGELDHKILNILRHEIGYQLLFDYCQQEFSLENVLLWTELESRSNNLLWTVEQRKGNLRYFRRMYLESSSARQLNISYKSRSQFLETVNMKEPSASDAEEAFKLLYGVCMINIAETLTRFCVTEQYKTFEDVNGIMTELKEDFMRLE